MTNLDALLKDLNARISENPVVIGELVGIIVSLQDRITQEYKEANIFPRAVYKLMDKSNAIFNAWLIDVKGILGILLNYKGAITAWVNEYDSMSSCNPQLKLGTIQVDPIIGGNSPIPADVDKFMTGISSRRFHLSPYDLTVPKPDVDGAVKEISQLYVQLKG